MANLFDMDNPIWRFMGRLADIFFITVLWAVCSLPIITAGASTSSLYYVTLKMAEGKEGYLLRDFFRSFKENFCQSTLIWLIVLILGLIFGGDLYYYYHLQSRIGVLVFWWFFVLAVLYVFILAVIFPLTVRLDAGVKRLFFMAFMVSLKNFPLVMLMIVLAGCTIAVGLFVFWPLLLFSAGAIAYINSVILVKAVFPRYGWQETGTESI